MEEDLKEMLGKRPDELEGETLKLFNAIMKIADERDELKLKCKELEEIEESHRKENGELREKVKQLEEENKQLEAIKDEVIRRYNFESIPVSLVEETIEELDNQIKEVTNNIKNSVDEEKVYWKKEKRDLNMQRYVLQELLEKR